MRIADAGIADTAPRSARPRRDRDTTVVTATVPVAALDCGVARMNLHLRETLHAERFAAIEFRAPVTLPADLTAAEEVRVDGVLTLAGRSRPLVVHAVASRDGTRWRVRGERTLVLSDFDLRPPRRFGGLLRVRDQVTVHFDVTVAG